MRLHIPRQDLRINGQPTDTLSEKWCYDTVLQNVILAADRCTDETDEGCFWSSLTGGQVAVWRADSLRGIVGNGGFLFFLKSDWHPQSSYADYLGAFQTLGAHDYASVFQEVLSLFPSTIMEADVTVRRHMVEWLEPRLKSRTEALDDQFYSLCRGERSLERIITDYVRLHPDQFFLPQRSNAP